MINERWSLVLVFMPIASFILGIMACNWFTDPDVWCKNELVSVFPAPDQRRSAALFYRDCGGAVATVPAWGPEVVLLSPGKGPRDHRGEGNLFASRVPKGLRFAPDMIGLEWQSDTVLIIRHDPRLNVRFAARRRGFVRVDYDPPL